MIRHQMRLWWKRECRLESRQRLLIERPQARRVSVQLTRLEPLAHGAGGSGQGCALATVCHDRRVKISPGFRRFRCQKVGVQSTQSLHLGLDIAEITVSLRLHSFIELFCSSRVEGAVPEPLLSRPGDCEEICTGLGKDVVNPLGLLFPDTLVLALCTPQRLPVQLPKRLRQHGPKHVMADLMEQLPLSVAVRADERIVCVQSRLAFSKHNLNCRQHPHSLLGTISMMCLTHKIHQARAQTLQPHGLLLPPAAHRQHRQYYPHRTPEVVKKLPFSTCRGVILDTYHILDSDSPRSL